MEKTSWVVEEREAVLHNSSRRGKEFIHTASTYGATEAGVGSRKRYDIEGLFGIGLAQ